MMLSAGEHPMWVAGQPGHSDWTMIARVYGRWIPSVDQSAGTRAAGIWTASLVDDAIKRGIRSLVAPTEAQAPHHRQVIWRGGML